VTANPTTPPLSPVLIAGMPLRPLPPVFLRPVLNAMMTTLRRRHPGVFERLAGIENPVFEIDPVDLPFAFLLKMSATAPGLSAHRKDDPVLAEAGATIRGPLLSLIELLEGHTDGDALFFSRQLSIEGDTEAVVALRNAIDDAEVDLLSDIMAAAGPLAPPLRQATNVATRLFRRATTDLELLRAAILEPTNRRLDGFANANRNLEKRVSDLHSARRRGKTRVP